MNKLSKGGRKSNLPPYYLLPTERRREGGRVIFLPTTSFLAFVYCYLVF